MINLNERFGKVNIDHVDLVMFQKIVKKREETTRSQIVVDRQHQKLCCSTMIIWSRARWIELKITV